ncbi:hypothetical protein PG990_014214 [Apiospora arundinis]
MEIVQQFVAKYSLEQERKQWEQLKNCAIGICDNELKRMSIVANVTGRVKSVSSLKKKLESRHAINAYLDEESIMRDQLDFVGLRIALYFPQQKQQVIQMINANFQHKAMRPFDRDWKPDEPGIYQHLFGQYVADHIWACLLENDRPSGNVHAGNQVEIQLRSVLMDAWSGISHDIEYKALSGSPSITELKLLDALKGHVEVGEIMLEQLYSVHRKRVKAENQPIPSLQDLAEILSNSVPASQLAEADLGDLGALLSVLKAERMATPRHVLHLLHELDSPRRLREDLVRFKREFNPLPPTVAFFLLEKVLPDMRTEKERLSNLIDAVRSQSRKWYDSPHWGPLLWVSRKLLSPLGAWPAEADIQIYVHIWCAEYATRSLGHGHYNYDMGCLLDCLSKTTDYGVPGMEMFAALCMLGLGPEVAEYADEHDKPDYEDDRFHLVAQAMCATYTEHRGAWIRAISDHAVTLQNQSTVSIYQFLHSSDVALWLAGFQESELLASLLMHWPLNHRPFHQSQPILERILKCAENREDLEMAHILKEDNIGLVVLDKSTLDVITP